MNRLAHLYNLNRGMGLEAAQNREKVGWAIDTLAKHLPALRPDYEAEVAMAERWGTDIPAEFGEMARRNIATLDALADAVNDAQQSGLPLADIDDLAPKIGSG
jgi:hypothetical protein